MKMGIEEKVCHYECLVCGMGYGGNRIELLRLCFPFLKGVNFWPTTSGFVVCSIEAKESEDVSEAELTRLIRVLEFLTRSTFVLRDSHAESNYSGPYLEYDVIDGVPWPEYSENDDTQNGGREDWNPMTVYNGGPI